MNPTGQKIPDIVLEPDNLTDAEKLALVSLEEIAMDIAVTPEMRSRVAFELKKWWKTVDRTDYNLYIDEYRGPVVDDITSEQIREDFWFRNSPEDD